MKKMICCLALVAGGCLVSEGKNANAERQVAVVRNGEVFKVIYKSEQQAAVELKITDGNGNLVFREKIKSDGFIRPYNFSQLPKGDYNLSVEDETGRHQQTLCYQNEMNPEAHEMMAHIAKVNDPVDAKYILSIPGQEMSEVNIRIFDKAGNLVFSEVQNAADDFAKVYNLKNMDGAVFHLTSKTSGFEKIFPVGERP